MVDFAAQVLRFDRTKPPSACLRNSPHQLASQRLGSDSPRHPASRLSGPHLFSKSGNQQVR